MPTSEELYELSFLDGRLTVMMISLRMTALLANKDAKFENICCSSVNVLTVS